MKSFLKTHAVTLISLGCLALCLLNAGLLQNVYDKRYRKVWSANDSSLFYAMPTKILPYVSFGFRSILADYYFLTIVQNPIVRATNKDLYLHYFYNISELDPRFTFSYRLALFIISSRKNPQSTDSVEPYLKEGIVENPDDWDLPFALGLSYHIDQRNFEKAVYYIGLAAKNPHAPERIKGTYEKYVARVLSKTDPTEDLFAIIASAGADGSLEEIARQKIFLNSVTTLYEKALDTYKEKVGHYPQNLAELDTLKIATIPAEVREKLDISYIPYYRSVEVSPLAGR